MTGPDASHDRGAPSASYALERSRAAEDRLRIDRLGQNLPRAEPTLPSHGRGGTAGLGAQLRRARRWALAPRATPVTRAVSPELVLGPIPAGLHRFAICIAAPNDRMAARWGDWHLTAALARALDRRGHAAHVLTAEHHHDDRSASCDVRLVIRGRRPVPRAPGTTHVVWIISHPEQVDTAECDEADLVLVASQRFADHLRARTSTPVEVVLQATDPYRFRPIPAPQPRPVVPAARPVVIVAKTRDVARPMVLDAVRAGLRPVIYGTGWAPFVDPELIARDYVANEELPVVYSGAGVVLADHWESMRDWGFVANRLYDVLACGTPVISDDLPEVHDLFEGTVSTYRDPNELASMVETERARGPAIDARVDAARRIVLARHTFDDRADHLIELVDALRPRPAAR